MNLYGYVGNDGVDGVDLLGESLVRIGISPNHRYNIKVVSTILFDCVCDPDEGEVTPQDIASCKSEKGHELTETVRTSDLVIWNKFRDWPLVARNRAKLPLDDIFFLALEIARGQMSDAAVEKCRHATGRCIKADVLDVRFDYPNSGIVEIRTGQEWVGIDNPLPPGFRLIKAPPRDPIIDPPF